MAGLVSAMSRGLSNFIGQYRRAYYNPMEVEGGAAVNQQSYYGLLWAYYENSAFENIAAWAPYKGQNRLYRTMRLLYNPTRVLADFYAGHVYPGVLTVDASLLPEGTPSALPLAEATSPAVRAGLSALWEWSRWQANKSVLCRYGAIAGSVLLEVVDDVDAGRVYINIVWPGLITYLDLDPTGMILAYVLQYPARSDDGTYYEYRKEVDRDEIRFFKDDQPYDYGEGTSYPNPYSFVPAVWIKHKDLGGNTGAPAIHGSINKIDELNSLASQIHDQIHKVIGAPMVLWSDGQMGNLFGNKAQTKGPQSNPYDVTDLDREGLLFLKGPTGGRVDSLAGQLQLHEAAEYVVMLQTEIERDHPEVTMYRQLREMTQVTGPAATRLMGDVVTAVAESAANYDQGCATIFSMCLAIGGWRANNGDWGILGADQVPFRPFSLEQYTSGQLKISIMPRALIQMSEIEMLELQQLRDSMKAGATTSLTANLRESLPE